MYIPLNQIDFDDHSLTSIGAICRKHGVKDYLTFPDQYGTVGINVGNQILVYHEFLFPLRFVLTEKLKSAPGAVHGNYDSDINAMIQELEELGRQEVAA